MKAAAQKGYNQIMDYVRKECIDSSKETGIYNKMAIFVLNMFGLSDSEMAEKLKIKEKTIYIYKRELIKAGFMSEDYLSIVDEEHFEIDLCMLSLCLRGFVIRTERLDK